MKRGDAALIAQLAAAMQDTLTKLDDAQQAKDVERFERAKKELLSLTNQVNALL